MLFLKLNSISYCDSALKWQMNYQDPASGAAEGMIFFHDYIFCFITGIGFFVFWLLFYIMNQFNEQVNKTPQIFAHCSSLESIWTFIPAFVLILIAVPSFSLLYALERRTLDDFLILRIVGHQWYWSYEYEYITSNTNLDINWFNIEFDSYMKKNAELDFGQFRLLEVDNRVKLPIMENIRLMITSADVLHSWCIPSFGIKMDACPGRMNSVQLLIKRQGVFYGQCSEICGVNHGFMPIVVEGLINREFDHWSKIKGAFKNLNDSIIFISKTNE